MPLGISQFGPEVLFWFTFTIFLLISLFLASLGVKLQSDAPRDGAAVYVDWLIKVGKRIAKNNHAHIEPSPH